MCIMKLQMEPATRVQILEEVVYVSLPAKSLKEAMNSTFLPLQQRINKSDDSALWS